ncbi:MAG: PaaX family transcriptional regulator [Marinovum sp.]|nr:PaaX family transcriptional regulator [Marinovum sp.]
MRADPRIDIVLGPEPPRVWSFLVTILGDLARKKGDRISGTALSALTAAIEIKPEATRVALHRLRRDGWINTERDGRTSLHGLTDMARAQAHEAVPFIYGDAPTAAGVLILHPAHHGPSDARNLAPMISLSVASSPDAAHVCFDLTVEKALPTWVRNAVLPEDVVVNSADVATRFAKVMALLDGDKLDPLTATALRVSVLHEWRRLILAAPPLSPAILPEGWQGDACRRHFQSISEILPAPTLSDLEIWARDSG